MYARDIVLHVKRWYSTTV